jgi:hypothetical protein
MMKKNKCTFFSQSLSRIILVVTFLISSTGWAQEDKSDSQYLRELEKFRRTVKLTPILLDKTEYGPDDVIKPLAGFMNTGSGDLALPLKPGVPVTVSSNKTSFATAAWEIHRKDNKPVFINRFKNKTDTLGLMGFILFDSTIKAGESSKINFRDVSIRELNLPSGQYELILQTAPYCANEDALLLRKISAGNLTATQKIVFSVNNPDYQKTNLSQVKEDSEKLDSQNEPFIRKITSTLKVSELSLSATVVKKGNSFKAECHWENPAKEDLVCPLRSNGSLSFSYQWYVVKLPEVKGKAKMGYGGGIFNPAKIVDNNQNQLTIPTGFIFPFEQEIKTDELEIGSYEVSVEVSFGGKKIKTSSAKFKVIK